MPADVEGSESQLADARRAAPAASNWRSPSTLALIAANLLPLYGVLAWDWQVGPLLVLFWLENVIIGVLTVARMLLAAPSDLGLWLCKPFLIPIFCFAYGMATLFHGFFVIAVFMADKPDTPVARLLAAAVNFALMREIRNPFADLSAADVILNVTGSPGSGIAFAALAASQFFSFFRNYLWQGEYRRASLGALTGMMWGPFFRITVLHFALFAGGWGIFTLGSPLWAMLLLVVFKTCWDLTAHLREHRAVKD
jgi:hypothetical protein